MFVTSVKTFYPFGTRAGLDLWAVPSAFLKLPAGTRLTHPARPRLEPDTPLLRVLGISFQVSG